MTRAHDRTRVACIGAAAVAFVWYSYVVNPLPILVVYNRMLARYVDNSPIIAGHDTLFPWTRKLEENWHVVRSELGMVLRERNRIPLFQQVDLGQLIITR